MNIKKPSRFIVLVLLSLVFAAVMLSTLPPASKSNTAPTATTTTVLPPTPAVATPHASPQVPPDKGVLENIRDYFGSAQPKQQQHVASVKPEQTLKGKVVVVDAGHGGSDPGAVRLGVKESDITLAIALQLQKDLQAIGAKVVMTRTDDSDVELEDRRKITEGANPDLFVSIHINVAPYSSDINGLETYYRLPVSQTYAHTLHAIMLKDLSVPDHHVHTAKFYVINCDMPAILAEVGFITNKEERRKLISPAYQKTVADAITDGIVFYWHKTHPPKP